MQYPIHQLKEEHGALSGTKGVLILEIVSIVVDVDIWEAAHIFYLVLYPVMFDRHVYSNNLDLLGFAFFVSVSEVHVFEMFMHYIQDGLRLATILTIGRAFCQTNNKELVLLLEFGKVYGVCDV
jgi:hypothetical protein